MMATDWCTLQGAVKWGLEVQAQMVVPVVAETEEPRRMPLRRWLVRVLRQAMPAVRRGWWRRGMEGRRRRWRHGHWKRSVRGRPFS